MHDLVDPSRCHHCIKKLIRTSLIFARRALVNFTWAAHPKSLVRALIIKFMTPKIEGFLVGIFAQAFQFQTDITVHSLMRSVILGMTRTASFQIDSQGYPPRRQAA